eukprot:10011416-Ditylum_brightwellii.AAC.1
MPTSPHPKPKSAPCHLRWCWEGDNVLIQFLAPASSVTISFEDPSSNSSVLLSAGLLQQFIDPAFQQLAVYFLHYQMFAAAIGAITTVSA